MCIILQKETEEAEITPVSVAVEGECLVMKGLPGRVSNYIQPSSLSTSFSLLMVLTWYSWLYSVLCPDVLFLTSSGFIIIRREGAAFDQTT